jgi:hypothetical protein
MSSRAGSGVLAAVLLVACVERPIIEQEPLTLEEHCELFCEAQVECSNARFSRDPCFGPCFYLREQRPWESEGCYDRQRAYETCIVERGCAGWDEPECDALGRAIDCEPAPSDDD